MLKKGPAALGCLAIVAACGAESGAVPVVVLATTHTIEDSGLLETLDSAFAERHPEVRLRILVVGSGEALEIGRRRDADVLFTHAPEDEARFVAEGHGVERRAVMHNDFVVYGPATDPARVGAASGAADGFRRVAAAGAPFVSRGDDSGTHRKERSIWEAAGVAPAGEWYLEAGLGQGDALRVASQRRAYMLADRATYTVLRPMLDLVPLVQDDTVLVNRYGVTLVEGARNPGGARIFADWLIGEEAAGLIRGLGTDASGRPLFTPSPEPRVSAP
jgi:tungstate transport system substrate-binding protein